MKTRSGFTLVEVMAAISVGSILLVLSMGVVHRVLNVESHSRDQARIQRSLSRLSHDFRRDVQRASSIEQNLESLVKLRFSDKSTITYRLIEGNLHRTQESQEKTQQRESYLLPADAVVTFLQSESPNSVELTITRDLQLVRIPPRPMLHDVAEVGRLARLAQSQESAL